MGKTPTENVFYDAPENASAVCRARKRKSVPEATSLSGQRLVKCIPLAERVMDFRSTTEKKMTAWKLHPCLLVRLVLSAVPRPR